MHHFIDRRLNPKDKSLGNRQRFIRRARAQIKEVVDQAIKDRKITDIVGKKTVSIPTKSIGEPRLRHSTKGGARERIFTGNKEFTTGDRIPKPQQGAGEQGSDATDSGDGEDEFQFVLTREEFLSLFFEDLELPDLVKKDLHEIQARTMRRAGYTTSGNPVLLDVPRTMRNSLGRRIALKRPGDKEFAAVQEEIFTLEAKSNLDENDRDRLKALHVQLEELDARCRRIAYIDPFDVRYKHLQPHPVPNTKAVMFCLMDVSGSMGDREKDLAKRFFVLLHLFLKRRYDHIDVVFIRHTHEAQEVDEDTFFYSRETGGTVVSTALREMLKVQRDRYPPDSWNIYAAQASDGENFSGDSERCTQLLQDELMPLCQYYAYVEILDEREVELFRNAEAGAALWRSYRKVGENWPNFAMKRIAKPGDIYPVFRELFAKQSEAA